MSPVENYAAHRLAWFMTFGYWPEHIDHINGVRDDNRLCNLRECTKMQNAANRCQRKDSKQPAKGIYHHKSGGWVASIQVRKDRRYIGYFKTEQEARLAYQDAAVEGFAEFNREEV